MEWGCHLRGWGAGRRLQRVGRSTRRRAGPGPALQGAGCVRDSSHTAAGARGLQESENGHEAPGLPSLYTGGNGAVSRPSPAGPSPLPLFMNRQMCRQHLPALPHPLADPADSCAGTGPNVGHSQNPKTQGTARPPSLTFYALPECTEPQEHVPGRGVFRAQGWRGRCYRDLRGKRRLQQAVWLSGTPLSESFIHSFICSSNHT